MVKFTHYLVTRFNVPASRWHQDRSGRPTLDAEWMRHRLDLFEKFCLPTIQGQSEKNFHWLLYCDVKTNPDDLQKINSLIQNIPNARIRHVAHMDDLIVDFKNFITSAATEFIITSRLDNDDGLSVDYISSVQKLFKEKDQHLVNFCTGISYDIHNRVLTSNPKFFLNHYGSLIENKKPADELITIMGFHHTAPPAMVSIENVTGNIRWLKIIHDRNAKSQQRGKILYSRSVSGLFNLNENLFPVSKWNSFWYAVNRLLKKF